MYTYLIESLYEMNECSRKIDVYAKKKKNIYKATRKWKRNFEQGLMKVDK